MQQDWITQPGSLLCRHTGVNLLWWYVTSWYIKESRSSDHGACTSCTHRTYIKWATRTESPGLAWISADILQHLKGVNRIFLPPLSSTVARFCRMLSYMLSDFVPLKTRSTLDRSISRSLLRWVLTKSSISQPSFFFNFPIYQALKGGPTR